MPSTSPTRPSAAAGVIHQPTGNMEGKEVRFGDTTSALYDVASTQTSTGSVNGANDSYTPDRGDSAS